VTFNVSQTSSQGSLGGNTPAGGLLVIGIPFSREALNTIPGEGSAKISFILLAIADFILL